MSLAEIIYQHRFVPTSKKKDNDTEAFLAALAGGLSKDFPDDIDNEDLGIDALRDALD